MQSRAPRWHSSQPVRVVHSSSHAFSQSTTLSPSIPPGAQLKMRRALCRRRIIHGDDLRDAIDLLGDDLRWAFGHPAQIAELPADQQQPKRNGPVRKPHRDRCPILSGDKPKHLIVEYDQDLADDDEARGDLRLPAHQLRPQLQDQRDLLLAPAPVGSYGECTSAYDQSKVSSCRSNFSSVPSELLKMILPITLWGRRRVAPVQAMAIEDRMDGALGRTPHIGPSSRLTRISRILRTPQCSHPGNRAALGECGNLGSERAIIYESDSDFKISRCAEKNDAPPCSEE